MSGGGGTGWIGSTAAMPAETATARAGRLRRNPEERRGKDRDRSGRNAPHLALHAASSSSRRGSVARAAISSVFLPIDSTRGIHDGTLPEHSNTCSLSGPGRRRHISSVTTTSPSMPTSAVTLVT